MAKMIRYVCKGVRGNLLVSDIAALSCLRAPNFSTNSRCHAKSYKLVIAGGGCGGTAAANMFAKKLGAGQVAIVEPKDVRNFLLKIVLLY